MRNFIITAFALGCLTASCAQENKSTTDTKEETENPIQAIATVTEAYQTTRDTLNNVDTPAIWHGPDGQHWLLATAKETDVVLVYNATNGERLDLFGGSGTGAGELERPNSIAVIDSIAVVVERDNHRVQLFGLPSFNSLATFGEEKLIKPYGMSILKTGDQQYRLFVTDNYETADEQVPPDNELGHRVHEFRFENQNGVWLGHHVRAFGDTAGSGILKTVESLMADEYHNRLLIADEDSTQKNIKVYNLEGSFTGKLMGDGLFKYEPEGIALYSCGEGNGYWITADQSEGENLFYVFDRRSLDHIGTFQNPNTTNTDGITITQQSFPGFPEGGFFPIHNDGNVSAISWGAIAGALDLEVCRAGEPG